MTIKQAFEYLSQKLAADGYGNAITYDDNK